MADAQVDPSGIDVRHTEAVARLEALKRQSADAALNCQPFDYGAIAEAEAKVEALSGADAELVRRDREADAKARAEEIEASRLDLAEKAGERLDAIGRAERATRDQAEALRDVLRISGEMCKLAKQIRKAPLPLSRPSVERWLSARLAAVLRPVIGKTRFYGAIITFGNVYESPDDADWAEGARRILAGDLELLLKGKGNGKDGS